MSRSLFFLCLAFHPVYHLMFNVSRYINEPQYRRQWLCSRQLKNYPDKCLIKDTPALDINCRTAYATGYYKDAVMKLDFQVGFVAIWLAIFATGTVLVLGKDDLIKNMPEALTPVSYPSDSSRFDVALGPSNSSELNLKLFHQHLTACISEKPLTTEG